MNHVGVDMVYFHSHIMISKGFFHTFGKEFLLFPNTIP